MAVAALQTTLEVDRLIAWLQNFRRIVMRYKYNADNDLGFVYFGCTTILLGWYL
jgi:hypothetical protein